jgi:hypothetical protein
VEHKLSGDQAMVDEREDLHVRPLGRVLGYSAKPESSLCCGVAIVSCVVCRVVSFVSYAVGRC